MRNIDNVLRGSLDRQSLSIVKQGVVWRALVVSFALMLLSASQAQAATLCTLVVDAITGSVLLEAGDCQSRVTPASTFKVPLAVMAYDAGILEDAHAPVMAFQPGDLQRAAPAVHKTYFAGRTARCWIPACAGMTWGMWARLRPFART